MKRTTTLLWGCLIFVTTLHAQTVDLQFASQETKLIGPSPEAAAMTRYADTPVSYCLGIAQGSLPLYEIKSRSLALPISLSYDASGVRVDAVSGPVGLNWTLEAGGVITRTVAGIPDDAPVYFEHPRETLPSGTTLSQSDYDYLKDLARGDHDREWDLYSYNFP